MPRAILHNGLIYPIEPLPPEWADGRELWVKEARRKTPADLDKWAKELEALVAEIDPEDYKRIEAAIAEADRQAKGLSSNSELKNECSPTAVVERKV
jgi:hypothetical protein